MSTASLPSYGPSSSISPSLTSFTSSTPLNIDRNRLGRPVVHDAGPSDSGNLAKKYRNGEVKLNLLVPGSEASLGGTTNMATPTYGSQGCVEAVIGLASSSNITNVEAKIDGRLRLREIAEGGTTSVKLCLDTVVLWAKSSSDVNSASKCPSNLPFSLRLPTTFTYGDKTYPLPPTFHVKLSGLPGFTADIDYSVSVKITKHQPFAPPSRLPLMKSNIFKGSMVVSTPFIYRPRTRPSVPLPAPLHLSRSGFLDSRDWSCFTSEIRSKWQNEAAVNADDDGVATIHSIKTKLHVPQSRVFCVTQPIPFYLTFESSAQSLAAFLPYAPAVVNASAKSKQATRVQLMRQSTVDVRNTTFSGVKTDIWRVDCVGEGVFRHTGDGPTWSCFHGEIKIEESVKESGFKAPGLSVKDWIVFSVVAGDSHRAAFDELRQVIPVRLTTDPWTDAPDQDQTIVSTPMT